MSKRNVLKRLVNSLVLVVAVMLMCLFISEKAYASSASVTITTKTVTQGDEFDIQIVVKGDDKIYGAHFYLQYDAEIIEIVSGHDGGGGGQVELLNYLSSANVGNEITFTLKAKAKAPGTTDIKYTILSEEDDGIMDSNTENMSVTAKNGSITVKAPVVASKNNNLSSMTVAAVRADGSSYNINLSPAFSKDVTKYNILVEEGVTDLVVSAKTEDSKAKIYVQWPNLDPGDNVTKVIVTAEDGSKKEYVINTKVPMPETTTPAPVEPIKVEVDGVEYFIESVNDAVILPEGFETTDYEYNGKKVVVGKGLVKDLIVMNLTTSAGEAGKLYIYDEVNNSFYPMVNVSMSQKMYTIVKAPNGIMVPGGFKESTLTIGGVEFTGWQTDDIEGIYLVYAMNWEGKTGLYFYDTSESQMIKYFEMSTETGVGLDDYNNLVAENESLKADMAKNNVSEEETDDSKTQIYKYMVFIALAVIVILIGIILLLVLKKKKDDIEAEDDRNDAMDSAFANIVSKEETEAEYVQINENQAEVLDTKEELPEVLPEGADIVETTIEETMAEVAEEMAAEAALETAGEMVVAASVVAEENAMEETATKEVVEEGEPVEVIEAIVEEAIVAVADEVADEVAEMSEESTADVEEAVVEQAEELAEETVEEATEENAENNDDNVDLALENELKNAVENMFQEEISETIVAETVETVASETVVETVAETVMEEAIAEDNSLNKKDEKSENKERVAKILQDENTSIKEEELDLVIDELFDDLFGE